MLEKLAGPIIGALIGYCTNYIAVKMLFYPKQEVRIFGRKLPFTPGAIPKGKPRLARAIGIIVADDLLTEDDIKQKMISLETENAVVDQIVQGLSVDLHTCVSKVCSSELNYEEIKNRLISELSSQILDSVQHMNLDNLIVQEAGGEIVKYINEKGPDFIKEELETKIDTLGEQSVIDLCNHMNISEGAVRKIVADFYHKAIDSVIGKLIGNLNIAEIIEDKINAMNVDSLEKLVLTVMKKELDTIVNLGALVGAVLGVLNIII